jgi:acetyl-CoA C-acetyltransferase
VDGTVMMLTDPVHGIHMGVTAENVAARYGVSRSEQDEFALRSQQRSGGAAALSAFADEIVGVDVRTRKSVLTVTEDEHPRPGTTPAALAALRPVFQEGGTVTAGNSSGINDGGAAVVLTRQSLASSTTSSCSLTWPPGPTSPRPTSTSACWPTPAAS